MENPNAHEVIEAYERFGVEVPDTLVGPELSDIEEYYWQAFSDLSTERQATVGGLGQIPWSAIMRYNSSPEFVEIIRRMDSAYLNHKPSANPSILRGRKK